MRLIKGFFKNLFAVLFGLLIAFIISEMLLRLIPNKYTDWGSTYRDRYDRKLGYLLEPNQTASSNSSCFKIYPVHTNSSGFRDDEWKNTDDFKIAVLGDSFMEALQCPEGAFTSSILEELSGAEVLNAGIRGFGTVSELIAFREFLKPLKPKIAILFFLPANDLMDNSCELIKHVEGHLPLTRTCAFISDGTLRINERTASGGFMMSPEFLIFLRNNCKSCVSVKRLLEEMQYKRAETPAGLPPVWHAYMPAETDEWKEAWEITEKALEELKVEADESGARLLVVSVPEFLRLSRQWKDDLRKEAGISEIPAGFDPERPVRRLEEITKKNGIDFLKLEPYFIEYMEKNNMTNPYFSYRCDGHWSPIGHFLASNIVAGYLMEKNLLPLTEAKRRELLENIQRNLSLSPKEILGEGAYAQIYGGGIYKGESNIKNILEVR